MGENYFGLTDAGRLRTNNEDSFIVQPVFKKQWLLACVIDGVGGYAGGEIAAQLTRDEIIARLNKLPVDMLPHLATTLDKANERIVKEKAQNPQNENMACVVTLALVHPAKNMLYFAHVGDTRLYLFRDGSLIKITRDHSAVGFLEESGRLTEEAAMQHPKRNEVNKALGYEREIHLVKDFVDTGESPFLPGDSILLCSDGLTDMVPAAGIISVLSESSPPEEKCRQLVNAANNAGGKDNITVVLVQHDKPPAQYIATRPQVTRKEIGNGNGPVQLMPELAPSVIPVEAPAPSSRGSGWLWLLVILLLLACGWLLFKHYQQPVPTEKPVPVLLPAGKGEAETRIADDIAAAINNIVSLPRQQEIVLTDALRINNDSLHLLGNGTTLTADSTYKGPALLVGSNCRYLQLDSLTIKNFPVGISILGKGLQLQQVRFVNSRIPLQFQHEILTDTTLSGRQSESIFYPAGSLYH